MYGADDPHKVEYQIIIQIYREIAWENSTVIIILTYRYEHARRVHAWKIKMKWLEIYCLGCTVLRITPEFPGACPTWMLESDSSIHVADKSCQIWYLRQIAPQTWSSCQFDDEYWLRFHPLGTHALTTLPYSHGSGHVVDLRSSLRAWCVDT